jgi:hypothetical protein
MGGKRNTYRAVVGKSVERKPLFYLGVDGRIILKWVLKNGMEGRALV